MSRPNVLVLILAGGKGSRLELLTKERAKPALPFGANYRLIDFALSNCVHSHFSDVWIIEQYQLHSLNDHLSNGRPWDLDRTYGGLQVLPPFSSQDDDNNSHGGFAEGNADAIYRHRKLLREYAPDVLVVLSADHIYKLDLRDVLEKHLKNDADLTMVTTRVDMEEASRFGVVKTNKKGRVTRFEYKSDNPPSDIATTEVFFYNAKVLLDTLEKIAGEEKLEDFGHQLVPQLVKAGKVFDYRFEGYWRDVGTIESYYDAHMDLLREDPRLHLDDPKWPILSRGSGRVPARIHAGAHVENSLIASGCIVRGQVINSVLSQGVIVEKGAVVRDSIVLPCAQIGKNAQVHRAILDEYSNIGQNAKIGTASKARATSENITLVSRAAQVAKGAKIKSGAHWQAG